MISSILLFVVPFAVQANAASIPASAQAVGLDISTTLQNILANTQGSDAYTYPTDLTRGIAPVSFQTHTTRRVSFRATVGKNNLPAPLIFRHIPSPLYMVICLTLSPETDSLTQRLLAGCSLLLRPIRWLCLSRSGRLALQQHTLRRP